LSSSNDSIIIRGARTHNLKNVSCEIPHGKLTVVSGVSGSGKSSLAFDTIYAEGQRRYVESLSAYARQFLERIEKPDVDEIDGLAPAIAIKQKNTTRNPRSTVATATEIYDYLRLLYARCGEVHCIYCDGLVKRNSIDEVAESVLALGEGTRLNALFPVKHKMPAVPETAALLALMYLDAARFDARVDGAGGLLLLEEQDRSRWDRGLIQVGVSFLQRSARGAAFTRYHAEAGIAAAHCLAPRDRESSD